MRDAFIYTPTGTLLHVKLAETLDQRTAGLARTRYMPLQGMLFDFGTPQIASMTMRDTLMPLAMLFIDDDGIVQHIIPSAQPGSAQNYSAPMPVRWVLETSPDVAERLSHPAIGVRIGKPLTIYLPHGRIAA